MGIVGRYLDALPDDARDRVIEGRGWRFGDGLYADREGSRCLVGHAGDYIYTGRKAVPCEPQAPTAPGFACEWAFLAGARGERRTAWEQFDRLAWRRGMPRMVRIIKARAAKNHAPLLPASAPQSETAGV